MSYYMGDPSFQRQSHMPPVNPEIAINNNNFVVYGQQMPPVFPVAQQAKPIAMGADVYGQALPTINVIGANGLYAPNIQPNAQQSVNPDGSVNITVSFNAPDVKPQDACACLKDLKGCLSWLKEHDSSLEEMLEEMKDELPEKTAKFLTKILKGDLDERFGKIEEQIASGVLKIDKKIEASIERFSGDIASLKKSMKEENHDLKKSLKKFVKEQNEKLLSKIGDMMDEKLDAKLAKVAGQVEKNW